MLEGSLSAPSLSSIERTSSSAPPAVGRRVASGSGPSSHATVYPRATTATSAPATKRRARVPLKRCADDRGRPSLDATTGATPAESGRTASDRVRTESAAGPPSAASACPPLSVSTPLRKLSVCAASSYVSLASAAGSFRISGCGPYALVRSSSSSRSVSDGGEEASISGRPL